MRTLVNWISQGPGREKTAKYLDLLYQAVNPNIKRPLSTRIVDYWKDKRLKKKRNLEKNREEEV
jgi:hypothetical protein